MNDDLDAIVISGLRLKTIFPPICYSMFSVRAVYPSLAVSPGALVDGGADAA